MGFVTFVITKMFWKYALIIHIYTCNCTNPFAWW